MSDYPCSSRVVAPFTALPDGLAEMPAGAGLAAALASVDRTRLNGFQLVELVQARHRQLCFEQAQLLADVQELAYAPSARPDGPALRGAQRDPYAAEELAFALSWSTHAADYQLGLADVAHHKLPALLGALGAAQLDLGKVRAVVAELDAVPTDTARPVLDALLADPQLSYLTCGQLRVRLRRLLVALDPAAALARRRASVAQRLVCHREDSDGTATLTGARLPTERVAAAWEHLCRLATATKNAGGDTRDLDQIRADLFVDLLTGIAPTTAGARPAAALGGVHLHVELTTLIGLDEQPGELAGFGPIVADIARQVAAQLPKTTPWRFQLTHHGRLLHEGRLHYRPTPAQAAFVRARDRTCQAPGCRRPAHQCDIDHIRPFEQGGPTTEFNLIVLCRRHHRAKHHTHRLHHTDNSLQWTTPRGHTYPIGYGRDLSPQHQRVLHHLITTGETYNLRR